MHYLIYKITNNVNNIIYVGKHKTSDKDDGYMGSGLRLKEAIQSFGLENFTKEILFECESEDVMNKKEREIVDEVFVARLDTYNVALGGMGSWDHVNKNKLNLSPNRAMWIKGEYPECSKRHALKLSSDPEYNKEFSQKVSNALTLYYTIHPHNWTGRRHTTESKLAIGRKNAISLLGERNPNYGKCWIHNLQLKESTRITPDLLPKYYSEGWIKGRKIKF